MPESISVNFHLGMVGMGKVAVPIDLYDDDHQPIWYAHPVHGRNVDVVAIPFDEEPIDPQIVDYSVDEPAAPTGGLTVGAELFVVGYPFNVHEQQFGLATWTRATVASEPSYPFALRPCFLIDARTRTGQSGSPVLDHLDLGIPADMTGRYYPRGDTLSGVYSGRVDSESDLGFVWRLDAVREIIDGKFRPDDSDAIPI